MNKIYLFFVMTLLVSGNAQAKLTLENFNNQILKYQLPTSNVPENGFQEASIFLKETQRRIKKNVKADVSDYWNILTVFSNLNESMDNMDIAFKKFIKEEGSCEYLVSFEKYFEKYNKYLASKMANQLEICSGEDQKISEESIDVEKYAQTNALDVNLLKLISQIGIDDQRDRENEIFQNRLDIINQRKIDSLFRVHRSYIGKTLVGDQFKNVMWQVVQHSNIDYMEKYLPVIDSAVKKVELGEGALKYLIDRIYSIKRNQQIFGSQGGVKMADAETRNDIKTKYSIE